MSTLESIIVYTFGIAVFYALLLWFIHRAGVYFKEQANAIDESLIGMLGVKPFSMSDESKNNLASENSFTVKEIEYLQKPASTKIKITEE